jgi:hypothetical protein
MARDSYVIKAFTFGEHSFDIVLDSGLLAASVSANDGFVTFNPGIEASPPWAIRPQYVLGFESRPEANDEGREIALRFRTAAGERHDAILGRTSDAPSAELWVSRVNVFYEGSKVLAFSGNRKLAIESARTSTPMINGVLENGGFDFVKGRYWNSMVRRRRSLGGPVWPSPYNPRWIDAFLRELATVFSEITGHTKPIKIRKVAAPIDDSLLWTLDLIRPPLRRPDESRQTWGPVLSGELIFAHPTSRQYLEVIPQFEVTHFAVVFPKRSALAKEIAGSTMLSSSKGFGNVTLADWFTCLRDLSRKNGKQTPIITLNNEFASFHVANEVARSGGGLLINSPSGTIDWIATTLFEMQSANAIAVCDIGTAQALRMLYAMKYHIRPEENMMCFARYVNPAIAGLALPSEDPLFCEIGRVAWRRVIQRRDRLFMKSLREGEKRVEKLGAHRKLSSAA